MTEGVIGRLRTLHPPSPPLVPLSGKLAETYIFGDAEVRVAVASFRPHTSAGVSGLSSQHVKHALRCRRPIISDRSLTNFVQMVNLLAAGEACSEVRRTFVGRH